MDGTNTSDDNIASEPPSPFLGELQDRQADIVAGAEPWNDPREQRRAERRRDLAICRVVSVETVVRANEAMAGRIQSWECPMFKTMKDPVASLAKLNTSIVQIVLCEERLDETDEERIARIKAEGEANARATERAAERRTQAETESRRSENRGQVRLAASEITLAHLGPRSLTRSRWLDKFLADLDRDRAAFDRDPAQLVAEITSRLGLSPALSPEDKTHFEQRRDDLFTGARERLDALWPDEADDPDDCDLADPSAPPVRAQGPPH
jgi:hypothetical protein